MAKLASRGFRFGRLRRLEPPNLRCRIFTPIFVGRRAASSYDRAMTTFFTTPAGTHPALAGLRRAGFSAQRIEQVLAFYDEPHRRYHDREHIGEMLDAALGLGATLTCAQALALLFHDAVYVPGAARGANEALSAQLLRVYANGLTLDCIERAEQIVLDTAEHLPRSPEAELVLDLDLLRLAAPPAQFERYLRAVVAEQRALIRLEDDEAAYAYFCRLRRPFYRRLLARGAIYRSEACRGAFEAPARANLQAALARGDGNALTESDSRETA